MRRSVETNSPALSRRTVSNARCLPTPTSSGFPDTDASKEPRMRNSGASRAVTFPHYHARLSATQPKFNRCSSALTHAPVLGSARSKRRGGEMKSKWVIALLVAALGAGVYGGTVLATPATPSPGLATSILAQSTLDSAKKFQFAHALLRSRQLFGTSDLYVVDNKFQANATTGWHSHPGPSIVTIAAGTMTNYDSENGRCTKQVF